MDVYVIPQKKGQMDHRSTCKKKQELSREQNDLFQ